MERYPPEASAQPGQPVAHPHQSGAARPAAAAGPVPVLAAPRAQIPGERLAALGYLGVIFFSFLPALVIYLVNGRSSGYLRYHAARAVNLAVTVILFDLSAVIIGAVLALDTVEVGLTVAVPLATALWLVVVMVAVRAALAAGRGQQYELPGWLSVRVLR